MGEAGEVRNHQILSMEKVVPCSRAHDSATASTSHRDAATTLRPLAIFNDFHPTRILFLQSKMSNFQSIIDAVDKYATVTGINSDDYPFVDKIKDCDSPDGRGLTGCK